MELPQVKTVHVAGYIEQLQQERAAPTVKQHLTYAGFPKAHVNKRRNDRAFIQIKYGQDNFQEATDFLTKEGFSFGTTDGKYLTFNVSVQQLKDRATIHQWIASRSSPANLKKDQQIAAAARLP